MIPRYTMPEMAAVFSDTARFGRYLEIELLATEAHVALGIVPPADAVACRERAPMVDEAFVAAVDEIAEQYRAFDDARRATLVVVRGEPVRDDESGCIDGERSDVQEMIRACLEPTIERYKVDASAAALAAIATQRLFHKGAKRSQ